MHILFYSPKFYWYEIFRTKLSKFWLSLSLAKNKVGSKDENERLIPFSRKKYKGRNFSLAVWVVLLTKRLFSICKTHILVLALARPSEFSFRGIRIKHFSSECDRLKAHFLLTFSCAQMELQMGPGLDFEDETTSNFKVISRFVPLSDSHVLKAGATSNRNGNERDKTSVILE